MVHLHGFAQPRSTTVVESDSVKHNEGQPLGDDFQRLSMDADGVEVPPLTSHLRPCLHYSFQLGSL